MEEIFNLQVLRAAILMRILGYDYLHALLPHINKKVINYFPRVYKQHTPNYSKMQYNLNTINTFSHIK